MNNSEYSKIIFYDGECGFCNRSIQFILKHERTNELYFCSLHSEFAHQFFLEKKHNLPDFSSIYFWDNSSFHVKSSAILRIVLYLKWYTQPIYLLRIIPKSWSDKLYDFIAVRRKKIGGTFCVIPSTEQQARFIQ